MATIAIVTEKKEQEKIRKKLEELPESDSVYVKSDTQILLTLFQRANEAEVTKKVRKWKGVKSVSQA